MLLFLFTTLVVALGLCYIYFSQKVANQRRKIIFLSYQLDDFKSKVSKQQIDSKEMVITYKMPEEHSGEIAIRTVILIAPVEGSYIVTKLDRGTKVDLLDSAEILGNIWYEVQVPSENRVNNKGWIKKDNLIIIENPGNSTRPNFGNSI